jgi:hypothetical protein
MLFNDRDVIAHAVAPVFAIYLSNPDIRTHTHTYTHTYARARALSFITHLER